MASNKQSAAAAAAADELQEDQTELQPKFEWVENANNFLLRLNLAGFKKEDFRVQVDRAGRLTILGQRPATADARRTRFRKVFQLPSTANTDDITGRFEANVLTITVPKRPAAAPPATIQDIIGNKQQPQQQDAKPSSQDEDAKPNDESSKNKEDDEAKMKKPDEAMKKKEEEKENKAKTRSKQDVQEKEHKPTPAERPNEQDKPADAPSDKQQQAKPIVDRESLAEKVKRRAEEETATAAAAAEAAAEEKTTAFISGWKERVAGELEQLADMKWADGLMEVARKNKEVIATAVAAFSLGFFVSHKLFSRR
ncbi:hypothetical protein GUJ93_ZPchr0005g14337 [Zizania palustris]|uniref:SHSP domain-containing protein n=1 Tax=Zizania palustris TaxID=103762 RepID=A0A8J5STR0_ZIZPA|nr:hypothetical protein GUJ93_ZPchr0005g14337 [Zizania palustris]